ncbi:MAG: aminotransferase class I/II-fold pyridoxal phosphate-dependent enzyme [Planctomycetota bacterium]
MDLQRSHRLCKLPPYLFADLRRKIAARRKRGERIISLGIGDPDHPTPDPVVERLCSAVRDESDADRHRYGSDNPVGELNAAFADFYRRRWSVKLSNNQIVTTMGSKDAIAKLGLAILNCGDIGIAPVPGYPTYNISHVFAGAVTHQLPLRAGNNWLPDFDEIPHEARRLAKVLWLNYPNNPTTAVAPMEFFEQAVEFARENGILLVHDAAYTENTYDGYEAPSILQVDGADEVAVEMFSMSKAFNMTGWRVGAMVGNAEAVDALGAVKDNIDNGTLRAVQFAAAEALNHAEQLREGINEVYTRRRDLVVERLRKAGWDVQPPKATIYVWAPVPEHFDGDSGKFAEELLDKAGVVVTPGRGYGQWGEGYFRISLTYGDDVLAEAMDRIVNLGL